MALGAVADEIYESYLGNFDEEQAVGERILSDSGVEIGYVDFCKLLYLKRIHINKYEYIEGENFLNSACISLSRRGAN